MAFLKSQMYFDDYNWNARDEKDDPRVTGEPDSTLLDRTQGYEMLYFVNKCAKIWKWDNPTTASYQKIEKAVRLKVPTNIRSQIGIQQYIEANHQSFWSTV